MEDPKSTAPTGPSPSNPETADVGDRLADSSGTSRPQLGMANGAQPQHVLDPRRWMTVLSALIVLYLAIFIYKLLQNYAVLQAAGMTDGYDFMAFWSAAVVALDGHAALAYQLDTIGPIQNAILPLDVGLYPWHYPPSFLLVMTPLGTLPYLLAYFIWIFATLALLCFVMWRFVPHPATLLVLLAAPLTDRVFATGQTSYLTAALLGLFVLDLERRPGRSGLWLGLLTIKPQLGVLVPMALLTDRRWRTFATASLTALALGAAGLAAFGPAAWLAFFENLDWASNALANADNVLAVIASPFSALRLADVDLRVSYTAHLGIAAAVGLVVTWVWWRPFAIDLKAACLIAGSALMSPFHYDYDLMILAVPFAVLARRALRSGWLKGEPEGLFFVWLFPAAASIIAVKTGVQLGFVAPIVMLALCLRRTLGPGGAESLRTALRPMRAH